MRNLDSVLVLHEQVCKSIACDSVAPKLQQACLFVTQQLQGVPGDCGRLALTKTFLLSCEIDLGRQVDVPAVCDILNRASCTLVHLTNSRCACFAEESVSAQVQVMLGLFFLFVSISKETRTH